ncbi:integrase core domain protein (plasmid) [Bacillus pseudomycoides]|nr:integrase core domain protein [Bacillus pseudomycoides]AJI14801.1 integrase core domain protein [Bacillus pseudomycoides]PEB41228.1 IS6 family transposase [Bacillus pseudomycoides]PGD91633.1 IS6 family transposase [Bacillus pseudomycoides]PGE01448.1 IS6 family transposase [Bacillus pseudomycoides]
MGHFKGKQFKQDIILVAVDYYCRFSLSYRDVSEILKERGVSVHPTTIVRWVHEYGYLYRAIDKDGHTLDIQLRKQRNHQTAYAFMKRLLKTFGEPVVLTTDKAPALFCSFKKLRENGFYKHTNHCTIKHLNNLIEQDHRHVKRRFAKSAGFQNPRHTSRTLKGIETVHALYKRN